MLLARRLVDTPHGAGPARADGSRTAPLRAYLAAPLIAVVMLAATLAVGSRFGLGLRDPDGVIGARLLLALGLVVLLWALDIVPRAVRAARASSRPVPETIRAVIAERWSWRRAGTVFGLVVAFYLTYLCYRNMKSYLPLVRPELVDFRLLDLERDVFGQHPGVILHDLLGTGLAAHLLSTVYLLFLTFVPLSVAMALVWTTDMAAGLWWLVVLSLNWVLGAASYFILPSLGPIFAAPWLFAELPETGVSALQQALLEDRRAFVDDPVGSGGLQSIAAFASLHVSIVLSGALVAQLLRAARPLRIGLWVFFGLTVLATVYFGWHYVVDDIAGVVLAVVAVYLGAALTGWRIDVQRAPATLELGSAEVS